MILLILIPIIIILIIVILLIASKASGEAQMANTYPWVGITSMEMNAIRKHLPHMSTTAPSWNQYSEAMEKEYENNWKEILKQRS